MTQNYENAVAAFQIDGQPIRGRVTRAGAELHAAMAGHKYPDAVKQVLGEAMLLGATLARALKFDGRLQVQCHGTNEGAVSLLFADCGTNGDMRAYARYDEAALERVLAEHPHPNARQLIGGGTFALTIDQGPDMDRYQGLAAIEGESLSDCAEHYFAQSEQIPTRIKLAVGQVQGAGDDAPIWRGGAVLIQQVAGDEARGDTLAQWETAEALFGTLSDAELIDPDVGSETLLYRLFHEQGVRLDKPEPVRAKCLCSRQRLQATLKSFSDEERDSMFEEGVIEASCDFCGRDYTFEKADF